MKAKDRALIKLLEYLADPNNEWLHRQDLSTQVLGYKYGQHIHTLFTADELHAIEAEALELRRKRYSNALSKIDSALLVRALKSDASAILAYQRFEGWIPEIGTKISGELHIKHSLTERLKQIHNEEGKPSDERTRSRPRLLPAKSA